MHIHQLLLIKNFIENVVRREDARENIISGGYIELNIDRFRQNDEWFYIQIV